MFRNLGQLLLLAGSLLRALPRTWRERRKVAEQLFEIGNASLLMAGLLSFFIGGVIALQSGPPLAERGLAGLLGGLVGLSMVEELAPVMMAILIAGRIGSAMAAEIGSMRVYQEIDALRTMNLDPVRYLVLPRFVAMTLGLPLLVIFSALAGILGGALVAATNREIQSGFPEFFANLRQTLEFSDVLKGWIKAVVFAMSVALVCCHEGLQTLGGPRGIGRSVTKAVVNSIVIIVILDYLVTRVIVFFR